MSITPRTAFLALLLTFILAAPAQAEITIPVNDNNTGVFDQPSAVLDGATVRTAFIGDVAASGVFKIYYSAVNGSANFQNLALVRDNTVILTPATAVDNAAAPNDPYYDARHPKILMRSLTQAVILFQARPTAVDNVYRPYIALLTFSGNSVSSISVRRILFPAGFLDTVDIEDLSFGIATTGNTARMAFSAKAEIGAPGTFQVYFARVGLDNAMVVGAPILLSSIEGTDGLRPLPSLRLDTLNRAHIAWAANNDPAGSGPVYYALVKETNGVDNNVIQATPVLARGLRWGFPSAHVFNNSSIVVLAADETVPGQAGNIGFININPDADDQDGDPVQVAVNTTFVITPPGELILPDQFKLYHPDSFLDSGGRVHMAGYGLDNTLCYYLAFQLITTSPYFDVITVPTQVGTGSTEYPVELAGDYTRAAFVYMNIGRAVAFWSGRTGTANRNLDVSAVTSSVILTPEDESGCSMVSNPRPAEGSRAASASFIFLPAVILAVRRFCRRFRGRKFEG